METTPGAQPTSARRILAVLVAGIFLPVVAHAQQTDAQRIQELERKLEKSMELIERLNARVNQLERQEGTPPAPVPMPRAAPPAPSQAAQAAQAAQEARIAALERNAAQVSAGMGHDEHGGMSVMGIPLHAFADVDYERLGRPQADGRNAGFTLGNLDFYLTPSIGRVKMLAELNFEVGEEGEIDTDLERLQLGYAVSDAFTGWMGRFHTPYGYWNAAFHHGAQIQTVTRPRFIDFEDKGGVLPAHTVGLWGTGHIPAGGGHLVYDAYVGNGSRIVDGTVDFNAHHDDNSNKAIGANVGYRFGGALDGLLAGVHGLREDVNVYTGEALQARTRLAFYGAYFYLDRGNWEGIGEYYRFHNVDYSGGGTTHTSWAAFAQVGYTIAERWTPYYRWEDAALDATDPYFSSQTNGNAYKRNVLGIKYLLNPNTALKFEANRTREQFGPDWVNYTETRAQFAVRF